MCTHITWEPCQNAVLRPQVWCGLGDLAFLQAPRWCDAAGPRTTLRNKGLEAQVISSNPGQDFGEALKAQGEWGVASRESLPSLDLALSAASPALTAQSSCLAWVKRINHLQAAVKSASTLSQSQAELVSCYCGKSQTQRHSVTCPRSHK